MKMLKFGGNRNCVELNFAMEDEPSSVQKWFYFGLKMGGKRK